MTREEAKSVVKANGLVDHPTGDERDRYLISFYLFDDNYYLTFREERLVAISVNGFTPIGATSTVLGLNLGDPEDKVNELYCDYQFDYYGYPHLYRIDDHYFVVGIYKGVVHSWGIRSKEIQYRSFGPYAVSNAMDYMFGGRETNNLVEALGEPYKKEPTKEYERWYFRQGIEIDVEVIYDDYLNTINYIYMNSQCELKTDRGIGIGSTYEEVLDAYKLDFNPGRTNENLITIGRSAMYFVIKDNTVTSIYVSCGEFSDQYVGDFEPDR